jgi:hypothetical protein
MQRLYMVAKNDITGDSIMTKTVSSNYRDNYDRIFGKKNVQKQEAVGDGEDVSMSELRESRRDCVCSPQQSDEGREGQGD